MQLKHYIIFIIFFVLSALLSCDVPASANSAKASIDQSHETQYTTLNDDKNCSINNPCNSKLVCEPESKICTIDKPLEYNIAVNIVPQNQTDFAQTQFDSLDTAGQHKLNLTLSETIKLKGSIYVTSSNEFPVAIEPQLIQFKASGDIAGFDYNFMGTLNNTEEGNNYTVNLLPNKNYTVFIKFNELRLPPYITNVYISQTDEQIDFKLPDLSSYIKLTGKLKFGNASKFKSVGKGIKIVATSKQNNTIFSSVETDKNGQFTIYLPPSNESIVLQTQPTSQDPLFPAFILNQSYTLNGSGALGSFYIPWLPEKSNYHIKILDSLDNPVPFSSVRFYGSIDSGSFVLDVQTDSNGEADAVLYNQLTYNYIVVPQTANHTGVKTGIVTTDVNSHDLEITLDDKPIFILLFSDLFDGHPVAGINVYLSLDKTQNIDFPFDRAYQLTALSDGTAESMMEKGYYTLSVEQNFQLGVPGFTLDGIKLDNPESTMNISVPQPYLLYGTLSDPFGSPVPNAKIQFLKNDKISAEESTDSSALTPNQSKNSKILGEILSNENGEYKILLPF